MYSCLFYVLLYAYMYMYIVRCFLNVCFHFVYVVTCILAVLAYFHVFSSPEPNAQVSYCHSAPSVVRPSVHRGPSVVVVRKLSHFQLLLQNRLMDFDETWNAWSTHGPLQVLLFFGQIRPGADPGWDKNRSRGSPSSRNYRKATAINRMHSNDIEACGKKCCYFWFHSEVKFLTRFLCLFGLSHFALF